MIFNANVTRVEGGGVIEYEPSAEVEDIGTSFTLSSPAKEVYIANNNRLEKLTPGGHLSVAIFDANLSEDGTVLTIFSMRGVSISGFVAI